MKRYIALFALGALFTVVNVWHSAYASERWIFLTGATTDSGWHVGETVDEGGWITSQNDQQFIISAGAEYVQGTWYARATAASMVGIRPDLYGIGFYYDDSLTDGNSFSPTELARILDLGGSIGITFEGDTNTMFGSGGADVLDMVAGGNTVMTISETTAEIFPNLVLNDAYMDLDEISDPGGSANTVRIWVQDNAGTTELCLDFPGGDTKCGSNLCAGCLDPNP